jgi:glycosyltransferase involved in cell wall biosynthesis
MKTPRASASIGKVSILVPTYNHERYIEECLDSVAAAEWGAKELLVHDDGSSDNTLEVAKAWAERHAGTMQVRVTGASNAGPSAVLNMLLAAATGDFVVPLASDDRLTPDGMKALAGALEAGALVAFGDARVIDSDGEPVRPTLYSDKVRRGMQHDLVRELIVNWEVAGPVMMARRSALVEAGGWDASLRVEDWDLYLRLAATGGLRFVDKTVAEYRVHGANASLDPLTERSRTIEARAVARRRARDFRGRDRLLLEIKGLYLGLSLAGGGRMSGVLRRLRRLA